mgnify:CR=1 FL=1
MSGALLNHNTYKEDRPEMPGMNPCPRCNGRLFRVSSLSGDLGTSYEWNCLNCGYYAYP